MRSDKRRPTLDFTGDLPIIWACRPAGTDLAVTCGGSGVSALVADDVRALARLAGLEVRDGDAGPIAERLTATLALLAAVPDELLADVEPAFVLPMATPPA